MTPSNNTNASKAIVMSIAGAMAVTAVTIFVRRKRSSKSKQHSQEVSFPAADTSCRIYGALSIPPTLKKLDASSSSMKMPAIVIIAGSGPIDRDGNAKGTQLNTSNRFATHMMDRPQQQKYPVAVLAYDKRGVGKSVSPKDKNLYNRTGMMDLVADAVEAVRFLQHHPRIDPTRIVIMGHSEGAILIPLICQKVTAQEDLAPVKGCIFLAGLGETLFGAIALQQATIIREAKDLTGFKGWIMRRFLRKEKVEKQFNDLLQKIESNPDADYVSMYCGLVKIPAKWIREHKKYDDVQARADLAEHMTCHCLAITGQKDVQVRNEFCSPATVQSLLPNAASVESHRPPHLTHVLRSLDGPAQLLNVKSDYSRLAKLPLDSELLSIIETWCQRVLVVV